MEKLKFEDVFNGKPGEGWKIRLIEFLRVQKAGIEAQALAAREFQAKCAKGEIRTGSVPGFPAAESLLRPRKSSGE